MRSPWVPRAVRAGPRPRRTSAPPGSTDPLSAGLTRAAILLRAALPCPALPCPVPSRPVPSRPVSAGRGRAPRVAVRAAAGGSGAGGGARLCSAGRPGSARRRVTQPAAATGVSPESRRSAPAARTAPQPPPAPCRASRGQRRPGPGGDPRRNGGNAPGPGMALRAAPERASSSRTVRTLRDRRASAGAEGPRAPAGEPGLALPSSGTPRRSRRSFGEMGDFQRNLTPKSCRVPKKRRGASGAGSGGRGSGGAGSRLGCGEPVGLRAAPSCRREPVRCRLPWAPSEFPRSAVVFGQFVNAFF